MGQSEGKSKKNEQLSGDRWNCPSSVSCRAPGPQICVRCPLLLYMFRGPTAGNMLGTADMLGTTVKVIIFGIACGSGFPELSALLLSFALSYTIHL